MIKIFNHSFDLWEHTDGGPGIVQLTILPPFSFLFFLCYFIKTKLTINIHELYFCHAFLHFYILHINSLIIYLKIFKHYKISCHRISKQKEVCLCKSSARINKKNKFLELTYLHYTCVDKFDYEVRYGNRILLNNLKLFVYIIKKKYEYNVE